MLHRLSASLFGKQDWVKTEFQTKVFTLIHILTENRNMCARGPVHNNHSVTCRTTGRTCKQFLLQDPSKNDDQIEEDDKREDVENNNTTAFDTFEKYENFETFEKFETYENFEANDKFADF